MGKRFSWGEEAKASSGILLQFVNQQYHKQVDRDYTELQNWVVALLLMDDGTIAEVNADELKACV